MARNSLLSRHNGINEISWQSIFHNLNDSIRFFDFSLFSEKYLHILLIISNFAKTYFFYDKNHSRSRAFYQPF